MNIQLLYSQGYHFGLLSVALVRVSDTWYSVLAFSWPRLGLGLCFLNSSFIS